MSNPHDERSRFLRESCGDSEAFHQSFLRLLKQANETQILEAEQDAARVVQLVSPPGGE